MDYTYIYYVYIDVQLHHCVISLSVDQKKIILFIYVKSLLLEAIKLPKTNAEYGNRENNISKLHTKFRQKVIQ